MGREAAYSGNAVEWKDILDCKFEYGPKLLYSNAPAMKFGAFRELKSPLPGSFNTLAVPPVFETV